jgi:hypothetical protein
LKYIAALFGILTLVFWSPVFLAIVDLYCWYWSNHTLTGLAYDASGRPLMLILFGVLGVGCVGAGAAAGSQMEVK